MADCPVCNETASQCECSPPSLREVIRTLRAQLREAQEALKPYAVGPLGEPFFKTKADAERALEQVEREYDEAIERGKLVWQEAIEQARVKYWWWFVWRQTIERAERAEALAERLVTEIGHWVIAYGPDLIVYPSKEEIRAVNETPEFRIGCNATMQVVSEGLQAILKAAEALPQRGGDE